MWLILIGVIFVIGGLSGQMALRGTGSAGALAVVGGIMIIWGIYNVATRKTVRVKKQTRRGQQHSQVIRSGSTTKTKRVRRP